MDEVSRAGRGGEKYCHLLVSVTPWLLPAERIFSGSCPGGWQFSDFRKAGSSPRGSVALAEVLSVLML